MDMGCVSVCQCVSVSACQRVSALYLRQRMDMGCVSVCQCVGVSACQCPVPEAAYGHGLCVSVSVCT